MTTKTKENLSENKILLAKLPSIRNSYKSLINLRKQLDRVFNTDGLDGTQKDALELYSKNVNDKLLEVENHLKFLDSIYSQIPRVELTDEEKSNKLDELIVDSYIKNITLTTDICEEKLGFGVDKDYLLDRMTSIRNEIYIEIESQMETDKISEKDSEKLHKKLREFDFTKYQDMDIDELRSFLNVWVARTEETVKGKNLIEDKFERACVGIYTVGQGGTYLYLKE